MVSIALGVMEFIGGIFVGKLADKLRKINVCKFTNIIFQISLFLCLIADNERSYTFSFVLGAFWGFTDCSTQAINTTILGSDFK
jgi:predicted MFS family arabinose efflux permease